MWLEAGNFTKDNIVIISTYSILKKGAMWRDKSYIQKIKIKLRDYDIIFWEIASELVAQKINKILKANFYIYKFYYSDSLNAPPCTSFIQQYIDTGKNITVAGIMLGDCVSTEKTKISPYQHDYKLHLNISKSTIMHIDEFLNDMSLNLTFILDFNPYEYFSYKSYHYNSYYYALNYLKLNTREIIYIIGMPYIGKTYLAKNLALRWNYKYANNINLATDEKWSYFIDGGPVKHVNNARIFYLGEHDLSIESQKLLGYHLCLMHKKKYNIKPYNCIEIDEFFSKLNIFELKLKVEYITVINYQLFKYGEKEINTHYTFK